MEGETELLKSDPSEDSEEDELLYLLCGECELEGLRLVFFRLLE